MGYYTSYDMEVRARENMNHEEKLRLEREAAIALANMPSWSYGNTYANWQESRNEGLAKSNDPFGDLISDDVYKWYDHEEDMITISKEFPQLEFILSGKGEDYDDIWIEYFWNGECCRCMSHIVYDPAPEWSCTK